MKGNFELTLKNGKKRVYRYYSNALNAFLKEYGLSCSFEEFDKLLREKIKTYTTRELLAKYGH